MGRSSMTTSAARRFPREHIDAAIAVMESVEVWSGLAEWVRALAAVGTLYPAEMRNKHSRKGKSGLRLLMAACVLRFEEYLIARIRATSTRATRVPCWAPGRAATRRCTRSSKASLDSVQRVAAHFYVEA